MSDTYFDHTATTRPLPSVVAAILEALETSYANPSSLHRAGMLVEKKIEAARAEVARALSAKPAEIVFTGGGTEANALALFGTLKPGDRVLTSAVEHSSVRGALEHLSRQGIALETIPVDEGGRIRLDALEEAMRLPYRVVSVMQVNNEVGTIQPLEEIGRLRNATSPEALFHADGIQGFGKFSTPVQKAGVDLYSMSAHKINGPKGIGALYVREGTPLVPMVPGGGQEKGRRSGTENVPGILGFAEAVRQWEQHRDVWTVHATALQAQVRECVSSLDGARAITPPTDASPFLLTAAFSDCKAEALLHMLEQHEIYVSSGSACSKGKASPVLTAMGVPDAFSGGAIRISFGATNTTEDADRLCRYLEADLSAMRKILRGKQ